MWTFFYRLLADVIVAVHFGYVAFVVVGLVVILLGVFLHWSWVRNFWFRAAHLLMIGVVVLESLCDIRCPLTEWENRLRGMAGDTNETVSFMERCLHPLLFCDISASALTVSYCSFGIAVLCVWIAAPPRWPWKKRNPCP
jgi:hypothetical protein